MTPLYDSLEKTLHRIASQAHKGDVDGQGVDYIQHYERVRGHIRRLAGERGTDDRTLDLALCAASLHDVVEDHGLDRGYDFDYLERQGVPAEVLEVVKLLTHDPANSYTDYVVKLSKHPAAVLAKLGDLADNSDPKRPHDNEPRRQRYNLSTAFLNGQISEADYRAAMAGVEKRRALSEAPLQRPASKETGAEGLDRVR